MKTRSYSLAVGLLTFYLALGCGGTQDSPLVKSEIDYLKGAGSGMPKRSAAEVHCQMIFKADLGAPHQLESCIARLGDSTTYSYSDSGGKTLARGKSIYLSALRIKPLSDALERDISARLGPGESCPVKDGTASDIVLFRRWRMDDKTVFLRTRVVEEPPRYPAMLLVLVTGDRSCDGIVGIPTVR